MELHEQTPLRPLVNVRPQIEERLGRPLVDYDGLSELFHVDLQIPADIQPVIDLRSLKPGRYGYHMPLSRTIHVDPIQAGRVGASYDLTTVLLHESQHLADSMHHPVRETARMVGRIGVGWGSYLGVAYGMKHGALTDLGAFAERGTHLDGGLPGDVVDTVTTMLTAGTVSRIASRLYYKIDPAERSARRMHTMYDLQNKYADVISFPRQRLRRIFAVTNMLNIKPVQ